MVQALEIPDKQFLGYFLGGLRCSLVADSSDAAVPPNSSFNLGLLLQRCTLGIFLVEVLCQ